MASNGFDKHSASINNSSVSLRKERKRKCRVLFSYQPLNEDELQLDLEDVVEVLEEVEEGWWRGILKGREGVFPSNFVEELPSVDEPDALTSQPQDKLNSEVKPKPVKGYGYGNIFQDGAVKLKSTAPVAAVAPTNILQDFKDEKSVRKSAVLPTPTNVVVNDAPELPPKRVREQARVLFSYEAQNDDELSLKEGEIVLVLSKEIEDKGWWRGELNGVFGVFPDNFVQLIPAAEEIRPKKPERLDKEQNFVKNLKSNIDGKSQPDGNVNFKDSNDTSSKVKTSSLTRGSTANNINSEVSKKAIDEKVEKFDKMAAPPLPVKKPILPPPIKKTTTPSNYRNLNFGSSLGNMVPPSPSNANTSTTSTITNSKSVPDLDKAKNSESPTDDLDHVESSAEKLVHLTANRAKNPNRRPPSHVFLKGENEKPNGEVKNVKKPAGVSAGSRNASVDSHKNATNTAAVHPVKESIPEIEEKSSHSKMEPLKATSVAKENESNVSKTRDDWRNRQSPAHSPGKTKTLNSSESHSTSSSIPKAESKVDSKFPSVTKAESSFHPLAVDTSSSSAEPLLSSKLNHAPSTTTTTTTTERTVSLDEFLTLKHKVSELFLDVEKFKSLTNRHISELASDLKAERDKRLMLQAEVDTLKIQMQRN